MIDITDKPKGEFWTTLHAARVGENIVYHIGRHCGGVHRQDAMDAYDRGLVTLVQKRDGPGMFAYIAQKLDPKRRKK